MTSHSFHRRFIISLAIIILLICSVSAAVNYLIIPKGDTQPIDNLEYISVQNLGKLKNIDEEDMIIADDSNDIRKENGSDYLFIKGTVPEISGKPSLLINTDNNKIKVEIGGDTVYDTISSVRGLFGRNHNVIPIDDSYSGEEITFTVYCPVSFGFSAYLSSSYAGSGSFSGVFGYANIILAVLFLTAGIIYLAFSFIKQSSGHRGTYILSCVSLLLTAVSLFIESDLFASLPFLMLISGKATAAILHMACAVSMYIPFSEKLRTSAFKEKYFGINVAYAVVILFWPYDVFLELIIKSVFIIQLADVIALLYKAKTMQKRPDFLPLAALCVFSLVNIVYWSGTDKYMYLILLAGIAVLAASVSLQKTVSKLFDRTPIADSPSDNNEKINGSAADEGVLLNYAAVITPKEAEVYEKISERIDIGELLEQLVTEKCNGVAHHMFVVREYVHVLCCKMKFDSKKINDISDAALLHDIGKLCIPEAILNKSEALTNEEFETIKLHNKFGYDILNKSDDEFLSFAARVALEHHEHIDGSGYLGLHDNEICLPSKITAVADVFSALTAPRQYKKVWSFDEAFEYILSHSGNYFDPQVVDVFRNSKKDIFEVYKKYQVPDLKGKLTA